MTSKDSYGYGAAETFFGATDSTRGHDLSSLYATPVTRRDEANLMPDGHWGRPPSFDVSNNRVLCSCDLEGLPSEVVIVRGLHSSVGEQLPGVYVHKELLRSHIDLGLVARLNEPGTAAWQQTTLARGLFPRAIRKAGPVKIVTTTFAPLAGDPEASPRAVVVMFELENEAPEPATVEVEVSASYPGPVKAPPHETDVARAAIRVVSLSEDLSPRNWEVFTGAVPGHGQARWSLAICVDESSEDLDGTEALVRKMSPERWLSTTEQAISRHMGSLDIPAAAYYSGLLLRQMEVCRQSLIYSNKGVFVAGFWGSDVNDRPHVWMRDNFYAALAMAWFDPKLCADGSRFFCEHGLPDKVWGAGVGRFSPLLTSMHSLGNALASVLLAGAYLRATGDIGWLSLDRTPYDFGAKLFDELAGSSWGTYDLAPSLYISDGEARGDWHTGTNIVVWRALMDMGDMAEFAFEDGEAAAQWRAQAARVRAAVVATCVGEGPDGPRFYEGADRDGTFIAGHDGEESDLTLASYYGFTEPDDPLVTRHARAAFSPENPAYWAAIDGVQWWDPPGKCWGPTFPAYVHRLAGVTDEAELSRLLEDLRALADVDGSFWWWPYKPFCRDPAAVERGPGKAGWASGVFLCRMVKDVVGIEADALRSTVHVRPFSPWSYRWDGLHLGALALDIAYERDELGRSVSICNRGDKVLAISAEVISPSAAMPDVVVVNGAIALENQGVGWAYGRRTVRARKAVGPGERLVVQCSWRP